MLVAPPHPSLFPAEAYAQLAPALGGVVLSTANYSSVRGSAGPSSPVKWVRDGLARLGAAAGAEQLPKLMATLPLFGWDFVGERAEAVDGERYLALLEMHAPKRFEWHTEAAEHSFTYMAGDEAHTVYYPSVKAVAERLGMLRSLGVGVALWELGTGLDFFWDLL